MENFIPKWHREIDIFSKVKSLIIIEGNVLDVYQYPKDGEISKGSVLRFNQYLHYFFKEMKYENIVFYDSIQGFSNPFEKQYIEKFARLVEKDVTNGYIASGFGKKNGASEDIRKAMVQTIAPAVIVMDFVSRYIVSPERIEQADVDSFTAIMKASMEAKEIRTENSVLKNITIMIVNKINDLPAWFYLQNPNVKTITITAPTKDEREQLVKGNNFKSFFSQDIYRNEIGFFEEHKNELQKIQNRFVALTDGFTFTELNGLRKLCKNEKISIKNMCDVIDLYKYGISENPWKKLDPDMIRSAEDKFKERVKGQDAAIQKTLDVIKRAATGMAGLQTSSHSKPKGVLFFAGPTGTGKTETAKTLAEILFGDESCCIRFDMSEYSQSHSDQKLLGAPPGYVGYESGGQLTNAVKNSPFSILLFDEIEKAHPSIMDKFLQILEDGRMTDGQGNTVYFSETIIIFTSNLGIYKKSVSGERKLNVSPEMPYAEIREKVKSAIADYFKLELGRPEILNRIGENIVVYNFIDEAAALKILESQINKVVNALKYDKHITVMVSEAAKTALFKESKNNLANGGRGIGNVVESVLIDPLARYLFDNSVSPNRKVFIKEIKTDTVPVTLVCETE